MIDKIGLVDKPDEDLLLTFVVRTKPEAADKLLVEFASFEMGERLRLQRAKGFSGWNTAECESQDLKQRLIKNVESEDWVDVLNLAAMLQARKRMFFEVPF